MASKQVYKNANGINAEVTLVNPDTNFNKRTVELNSIMDKTPTIATLRAKTEIPETIYVTGYHSEGDGAFGSHFFRWNPNSVEADNGGTIIKLDSVATGRYELQYSGEVRAEWFGLTNDNNKRDVRSLMMPLIANSPSESRCKLLKIRDVTYHEFAVYTPLTSDGKDWHRWFFTNRFNVTNDGAPRCVNCSLASLYASSIIERVSANNVNEVTASQTTVTKSSSDGVQVGTWSAPATVLTTTDVSWSATIGDTMTYTITGAERLVLRGLYAGNGGIANITITESSVEIPEANYDLSPDHLINFISTATGNTTMHIPLASGLDKTKTYEVVIEVDSTNPATNRVYQAGLLGYDNIAYNEVGIHGILLDASLGGVTNSMSVTSGTTVVYKVENSTRIDWRYTKTINASISQITVYDENGTEISTYENSSVDMYSSGSTNLKATIAKNLPRGTYYLHVKNGKTKNASSTGYRMYDYGAIQYDELTAGNIDIDEFDDRDIPFNIQDPNNGSEYILIGTGNLELATEVRKTTDAVGVKEFVGGIHGHETTPTLSVYANETAIDYEGAVAGDSFIANDIRFDFQTTLSFPSDLSDFATVDYSLQFGASGYGVKTTITTLAESIIHDDFALMLNCPNTDASNQGLSVGGGFKYIATDINREFTSYDNSGTNIWAKQDTIAFLNSEYSVIASLVSTKSDLAEVEQFFTSNYAGLIQDRTDRTLKHYIRSWRGDDTNGVTVPAGTTWTNRKRYECSKGSAKTLVGLY